MSVQAAPWCWCNQMKEKDIIRLNISKRKWEQKGHRWLHFKNPTPSTGGWKAPSISSNSTESVWVGVRLCLHACLCVWGFFSLSIWHIPLRADLPAVMVDSFITDDPKDVTVATGSANVETLSWIHPLLSVSFSPSSRFNTLTVGCSAYLTVFLKCRFISLGPHAVLNTFRSNAVWSKAVKASCCPPEKGNGDIKWNDQLSLRDWPRPFLLPKCWPRDPVPVGVNDLLVAPESTKSPLLHWYHHTWVNPSFPNSRSTLPTQLYRPAGFKGWMRACKCFSFLVTAPKVSSHKLPGNPSLRSCRSTRGRRNQASTFWGSEMIASVYIWTWYCCPIDHDYQYAESNIFRNNF